MNAAAEIGFQRPVNIFHCFPKYEQARIAFWENIDAETGRKMYEDLTPYGVKPREDTMSLTFPNNTLYRLIGSDNYQRVVGAGPFIIIYSEWARCDPAARAYFLPMILRNGGIEVFITTMYGENHAAAMADVAEKQHGKDWFYSFLTVDDTIKDAPGEPHYGDPVVSREQLESLRNEWQISLGKSGMSEEMTQQEFYNSRAGVMQGAIIGKQLDAALHDGRITDLPILPGVPVDTYWDLGKNDSTCIWFVQPDGPWYNLIDFLEASGVDVDWYAKALQEKPYIYRSHVWPHDGKARPMQGSGESRMETGIRMMRPAPSILPRGDVPDGVNAMRAVMARVRIDKTRCARGLDGLRAYRYEWDEKLKRFRDVPYHDWASNIADAFRTFAMTARGIQPPKEPQRPPSFSATRGPNAWMAR